MTNFYREIERFRPDFAYLHMFEYIDKFQKEINNFKATILEVYNTALAIRNNPVYCFRLEKEFMKKIFLDDKGILGQYKDENKEIIDINNKKILGIVPEEIYLKKFDGVRQMICGFKEFYKKKEREAFLKENLKNNNELSIDVSLKFIENTVPKIKENGLLMCLNYDKNRMYLTLDGKIMKLIQ